MPFAIAQNVLANDFVSVWQGLSLFLWKNSVDKISIKFTLIKIRRDSSSAPDLNYAFHAPAIVSCSSSREMWCNIWLRFQHGKSFFLSMFFVRDIWGNNIKSDTEREENHDLSLKNVLLVMRNFAFVACSPFAFLRFASCAIYLIQSLASIFRF